MGKPQHRVTVTDADMQRFKMAPGQQGRQPSRRETVLWGKALNGLDHKESLDPTLFAKIQRVAMRHDITIGGRGETLGQTAMRQAAKALAESEHEFDEAEWHAVAKVIALFKRVRVVAISEQPRGLPL